MNIPSFRSIVRVRTCLPTTIPPAGTTPDITPRLLRWHRRSVVAVPSSYHSNGSLWVVPSTTTTTTTNTTTPRVHSYHSSSLSNMPIRRRRHPPRAVEEDTEEIQKNRTSPLKHASIDDDVEFVQAAVALLDRWQVALEPMKPPVNDVFAVERFWGDLGEVLTIDLGPKDGTYRIEMSLEDHIFEYSSPISGKILYVLSAETGEWVGIDDGHSFEGLLVRDLIRQCRGMPHLL